MSVLTNSAEVRVRTLLIVATLTLGPYVLVSAQSGKRASENRRPTVTLTINPTRLCYGGTVKVFANAYDPDGDKLTYKYTTDNGEIIGKGRKVRWWKFTELGHHKVEVEVSDGRGGLARASAYIINFELCSCPVLSMSSSVDMTRVKPLVTFKLNMSGGQIFSKPTYSWIVSSGKIVKGKGKPSIIVGAVNGDTGDITATVKIGNLAPECDRERSLTIKNPLHRMP